MITPVSALAATWVVAAIVLFATLAALGVWLIPKHQANGWKAHGIAGKELAELENGARTTIVQIIGGVALILTFAATWTQIADTRDATNKTLRLNELQQETNRFTVAVQELGSSNATLRLGGIYSLERLAQTSTDERAPVVQLMVAYLHRNHRVRKNKQWIGEPCVITKWQPQADTQAALATILRFRPPQARVDLSGLDLSAVRIQDRDFAYTNLGGSSLFFAHAEGASFDHASLFGAKLKDACLQRASFIDAKLDGSDIDRAHRINYSGADFLGASGKPRGT